MTTSFKKAGYTKDTKFKVIRNNGPLSVGDIVTLSYDDGSCSLKFKTEDWRYGWMTLPNHPYADLEVYEETQEVTEDPDGFIPWDGGEIPVPVGTMVHVKYRNRGESIVTAGLDGGDEGFKLTKGVYLATDWDIDGVDADIVAYKLHTGDGYVNGVKGSISLTAEDQATLNEDDMEGLSLLPRMIVSQEDNYNGHGQLWVSCELSSEDIKTLLKELEGYYEGINFNYNLEARMYSDGSGSIYVCNYWNDEDKKHPLGHKDKLIFSWGEKE